MTSASLVRRALSVLFPDPERRRESAALVEGLERHPRWSWQPRGGIPEIQLAVLKLCGGDVRELESAVAAARVDWRDVIAWAQSPGRMRCEGDGTPGGYARVHERDRAQYEAWLDKMSQGEEAALPSDDDPAPSSWFI